MIRPKLTLSMLTLLASTTVIAVDVAHADGFAASSPVDGAEVPHKRPRLEFSGVLPDDLSREQVRVSVDGVDLTEFLNWKSDRVHVRCPLPLETGDHQAELSVIAADGSAATLATVSFTTVPPGRRVLADGTISDSPTLEIASDADDLFTVAPRASGRFAGATGEIGYDVSFSHGFNLQESDDDYVTPSAIIHLERDRLRASGGSLSDPATLADFEFLNSYSHRKAVEVSLNGSFGDVSVFSNMLDALPSVGGDHSTRQWVQGLSWRAPSKSDRASIRVVGITVRERDEDDEDDEFDESVKTRERATLVGVLGTFSVTDDWQLQAETAWSDRTVDEGSVETSNDDWAFRIGAVGTWLEHAIEAKLSRVGSRYVNPVDPGLTNDRQEAEITMSGKRRGWRYEVDAAMSIDGLDDVTESSEEVRFGFSLKRKLKGAVQAKLDFDRQDVSCDSDSNQTKAALSLRRKWARLRAELKTGWTESKRPDEGRTSIDKKIKAATTYEDPRGFQIRGGGGLDRRDDAGRETDQSSVFLEPSFNRWEWLSLGANLARSTRESPGRRDDERRSVRATATLTREQRWRGLSLTIDAGWTSERDRLDDSEQIDRRIGLQLSFAPEMSFGRR